MADQRTRKAIQKCGEWLALCLRLGWSRDQLDALEALWWEHHNECGNLKTTAGVQPSAELKEKDRG